MAQILSPVCTDLLKFQSSIPSSRSSASRFSAKRNGASSSWFVSRFAGNRRNGSIGRLRVATEDASSLSTGDIADDYYAVLGLLPDASQEEIKKAYYNCMKSCHPDLSGNDPETTNFCMFINDIYEILSDPVQRMVYDEIHGYAVTAINPFFDDSSPKDHVFVDEFACIGCKNCANVAPDIFKIEEDFGRARACNQRGNPDLVQQAVETCPVDCIYQTSAAQLSLLEDEMRRVERVNVALMLSGMGSGAVDVFRMARSRWEKRQAKVLNQARSRMMKRENKDEPPSYWDNLWGKQNNYQKSEEEVQERAQRAAAAARKWREYSRRGVDKRPTFKLPDSASRVTWAAHVINRSPTSILKKTPEAMWSGVKPTVDYFRVFGCLAYVHVPNQRRTKLDDKSITCVLIGVSKESKGYRLYNPVTETVLISRDVVFDEEKGWNWKKIVGETKNEKLIWEDYESDIEPAEEETVQPNEEETAQVSPLPHDAAARTEEILQRSQTLRIRRPPTYLQDYVTGEEEEEEDMINFVMFASVADPVSYEEAKGDTKWIKAMETELESTRSWHSRIEAYITKEGFRRCEYGHTLFIKSEGVEVIQDVDGIFIHQKKYAGEILEMFNLQCGNEVKNLMVPRTRLSRGGIVKLVHCGTNEHIALQTF